MMHWLVSGNLGVGEKSRNEEGDEEGTGGRADHMHAQ